MADDGGKDGGSSSVHQVVFNDDLLIEILLRLPVISLFLFKSVSKRWLSLITSPTFFNLWLPNIHPPSGLFLQQKIPNRYHFERDFMWLDSAGKEKKKSSAFTFGCFGSDANKVEVLQSCNGLILCGIRTDPADKIYVYNPSNNVFKMLPPIINRKYIRQLDNIRLAFDPTKSPHYKVLHAQLIGFGPIRRPHYYQTRIYSSETSRWRSGSIKYPTGWFSGDFNKGVYWNDAIHWSLHPWNRGIRHFKLDVEDPTYTTTQLPINLHSNSYTELFESRGSLLFASYARDYYHPKHMEIYEMLNDYTGWSVRYIVNFEDSSLTAFLKMHKMSSVKCTFKFLFMMVGEREEESFVVMGVCGKIVRYNLLLKTLHPLCDIDTHYLTEYRIFPFIASFASV